MKKLLAVAIALVLALGCMSAFAAEGPIEGLFYPELPDNTLKITANVPNFGTDQRDTKMMKLWQEKMEEYLGVKLEIEWKSFLPWDDFRANESVNLAAKDLADVNTYSQSELVNEYGAQGVVLNVNEYADYMVYYPTFVAGVVGGQEGINNPDGTSYVFWDGYDNDVNLAGAQSFAAYAYRFDVLKKYDLKPAETWDEFKDLCAELKALIDSGEVDADYVLHNGASWMAFYRGFVGTFHTWDTLYWNGEEWAFGPIEDNFREMLTELHELYELGYINPEFQTDSSADDEAENGRVLIVPTNWAGSVQTWNAQSDDEIEWGLAYLPSSDHGTAWKWGSKITGKNLGTTRTMGIIISAETEYPEWVVTMIDYQYSPDIYLMLNWGVEGEDWYLGEDGMRHYTDKFMAQPVSDRAQLLADEGIMSSASARTGIAFVPQIFSTIAAYGDTEPWWNAEKGYYDGHYWYETAINGGKDSISPFDRAPVVNVADEINSARASLKSACEKYAKTESVKFITGELDITDDAVWAAYVEGLKSQYKGFDDIVEAQNEGSDLETLKYYND
ncbi:MAG: extracellular solute-binding protein [Clostridia bacterium]|nr:extracellular solute-binding protein [Clostridia bacterium]